MAQVTGVVLPNNGDRIKTENYNDPITKILAQVNGGLDSANITPGSLAWESMASFTNKIPATAMQDSGNLDKFRQEGRISFIASGMIWSALTGLNGTMTSGIVYTYLGARISVASIASRAFTASKDTYVYATNGVVGYSEVGNGVAQPAIPANSIWLAKVVTSASAITAVTDIRKVAPLDTSNVDASSTRTWTGWSGANFGTTQTSLGTFAVPVPAGCNYVEITGAIRLQCQDATQKDITVFLSNNQNATVTHSVIYTAANNMTFASATCALSDKIPVNPGTTVTFDMRAVVSTGAGNSSNGKITFKPVAA